MADEKIKVSWDDLRRSDVDQKLAQQTVLSRAQQHYQQPPAFEPAATTRGASIWYNSLFCMTVFGLIGGLIASFAGELAHHRIYPQRWAEYEEFIGSRSALLGKFEQGDISKSELQERFLSLSGQYSANPYVSLQLDTDATESDQAAQAVRLQGEDRPQVWKAWVALFICAGVGISVALALAEPIVNRNQRQAIINGSVALTLGAVGAVIAYGTADYLYGLLGGGQTEGIFRQMIARAIGWGVLGAFLAVAPGLVLKSPKRALIGVGGGALGGFLGGLLFDPVGMATDSDAVSRLVSITAIGALAGAGTGLIENVAKTGWLRVVAGLIKGKQFILYKNPTTIGSSPQCDIYLFKDPQVSPVHAAIHIVGGRYEIEDRSSATGTLVNGKPVSRTRLPANSHLQIGSTTLLFQEKERSGGA